MPDSPKSFAQKLHKCSCVKRWLMSIGQGKDGVVYCHKKIRLAIFIYI